MPGYILIILLSAVIVALIVFVILNYVRKLHWDLIHHNLLDLVDDIGGKVIRQGMLGRPVYQGMYQKLDVTINFSTEKGKTGRKNLIDISVGTALNNSFTISALKWLGEREESAVSEFKEIKFETIHKYGIRNGAVKDIVKTNSENKFYEILKLLDPFLFLYVGVNGLIFEKEGGNLAVSTKHPELKNTILSISKLVRVLS
jgi:hypothetical protein